jgi:hypothetical protein
MNHPSFGSFIFSDKKNSRLLLIALVGSILLFAIFKILYPYPDFFSDSYSYLYAASAHLDVSIWPIGYSKFLFAFHNLTHSDTALVGFQYFLYIASALYFFYTLLYFMSPGKKTVIILYIVLFFNPLFLYLCNYVNSDPLFLSLSLFWFTQLIWIIYQPKLYQLFIQAIFLFLCFTVRNNAYIYPFIAILAFILSRQKWWLKLVGMALPIFLIVPFIIHTRNVAEDMTGKRQYSLFTGWQLGNNALYMYGQIQVDSTKFPSSESRELNRLSQKFYSKTKPGFTEGLSSYVANFFIRQPESPLKQYFGHHYKPADEYEYVQAWGNASIVFNDFGSTLIKQHPLPFARYFLLINAKNYFLPPLEKLEVYNLGSNEIESVAQDWFDFTLPEVSSVSKDFQGKLLFLFPGIFLVLNLMLIGSLIYFLIKGGIRKMNPSFNRLLLMTSGFLALNFVFCVFATIIVLRYEVFPLLLCVVLDLVFLELFDKKEVQVDVRNIPVGHKEVQISANEITPSL